MKHRGPISLLMSSFCVALCLGVTSCDDGERVGVHDVIMRTEPAGAAEFAGGGCVLVSDLGDLGAGGGSGPEYAMEMATQSGEVVYRFFIAQEGAAPGDVTPANGELAAEVEADMEFFASGESKHVAFETYAGVAFEVFFWGEPDCEGDSPMGPPPQDAQAPEG